MVETIFNEMSETGLNANFNDFFAKLQDLHTNTPDDTYRNNVIKYGESLATFVTSTAKALKEQQQDINAEVETVVSMINNLGEQIANLNERISKYEADGSNANDLRDQRALLIDELSKYVNVEVSEVETNEDYAAGKYPNPEDRSRRHRKLSILINGQEFVNNWDVNLLEVVPRLDNDADSPTNATEFLPRGKRNEMDADGLYDIRFTNGVTFDIYSKTLKGELKGLIDVRDGNNGDNSMVEPKQSQLHSFKGIPHYLNKLSELVRTFAKAMNEGIDQNGNTIPGVTGHVDGYPKGSDDKSGLWLFTYTDEALGTEMDYGDAGRNYDDMNCFNFQVNTELLDDPEKLGCSDKPYSESGESNNKVIMGLGTLSTYQSLFTEGRLSDYIAGMAGELGIDRKQSVNFQKNYTDVTETINNQRMQVSGVSLNEEVLSMIQYQQQYNAAAKLMTVIDEVYDVMINRMGM
jgi:flagellar hook-associated protein 1 FlgK